MVRGGTRFANPSHMLIRSRLGLLPAIALLGLAACEVGVTPAADDVGGDDDDVQPDAREIDAPAATYSLAVTPPTAATTLGTDTTFTVTVDPQHWSGPITLAATGVPATWNVQITPATLTVTDGVAATATVRVTVPSNGDAAPTGATLAIDATSTAAGARSATASLTVAKTLIVTIGNPVGTGTHFGARNGSLLRVKSGTRLEIQNDDGTAHRIHTGGGIGGFIHQPTNMGTGQMYAVTVTDGSDVFYCHVHERGAGEVNLVVE